MKIYGQKEVRKMVRDLVLRHGRAGVRLTAEAMCVSPSYVSQVLSGCAPGPAILEYFGLRQIKGWKGKYESTLGEPA